MNKTISMSIRVSEEELEKIKKAAELEACFLPYTKEAAES